MRHRAGHPAVAARRCAHSSNALFAAGGLVVCGGILNRLNVSVFGLWSYTGPIYFPSLMEIVVTAAMFTFGAAVFVVLAKMLPVFPDGTRAGNGAGRGLNLRRPSG